MSYTVEKLSEDIDEKLSHIGVGKNIKKNPAYIKILKEIKDSIVNMTLGNDIKNIPVIDNSNSIYFQMDTKDGGKTSMKISSSDENTFSFISIKENNFYKGTDKFVMKKNISEHKVHIDHNLMIIQKNVADIDNIGCESQYFNNTPWAEKRSYNDDGVMIEREYKTYEKQTLPNQVLDPELVLGISRQAFDYNTWNNNYQTKTLLVRKMLDTAMVEYEDRVSGVKYQVMAPLNQNDGLQDMNLDNNFNPNNSVIYPLMKQEIDMMIEKEKNTKVQEGLKKYSIGRDTYSYSYAKDGMYQSVGKNR